MKISNLLIFGYLGVAVWAAPTADSALTKRVELGAVVAIPVMPRAQEAEDDDDVIYTDYKRSAVPTKEEEEDDDVIYTDYKRSAVPSQEEEDDDDVIYTDY